MIFGIKALLFSFYLFLLICIHQGYLTFMYSQHVIDCDELTKESLDN